MNFHHLTLYVTCKDNEEATAIARTLIEEKLIACANITKDKTSIYQWEGEIKENTESALMLKTSKGHVETIIERIKALHSYDCPCIVAWPIVYGNEDYLNWIEAETG